MDEDIWKRLLPLLWEFGDLEPNDGIDSGKTWAEMGFDSLELQALINDVGAEFQVKIRGFEQIKNPAQLHAAIKCALTSQ